MVQLSRRSLVVPVLTETVCPGMTSSLLDPKAPTLALLSRRIWEMM